MKPCTKGFTSHEYMDFRGIEIDEEYYKYAVNCT